LSSKFLKIRPVHVISARFLHSFHIGRTYDRVWSTVALMWGVKFATSPAAAISSSPLQDDSLTWWREDASASIISGHFNVTVHKLVHLPVMYAGVHGRLEHW